MNENRVVDVTCEWLLGNGYEIESKKYNTEPGDDIVARSRNGALFYIECKGSDPNAGGKEFSIDAKYKCAAAAFFNQMRLRETKPQSEVGIAFPDDKYYRGLMGELEAFCMRNRVRIFWVSENLVSEW